MGYAAAAVGSHSEIGLPMGSIKRLGRGKITGAKRHSLPRREGLQDREPALDEESHWRHDMALTPLPVVAGIWALPQVREEPSLFWAGMDSADAEGILVKS